MLGEHYSVLEASDGEEAVNIARKQKPDLILMDIWIYNQAIQLTGHAGYDWSILKLFQVRHSFR